MRWATKGHEAISPLEFYSKALPLSREMPAILFLYALWCGPCRAMQYTMNNLGEQYAGRITFWEITVDEKGSEEITEQYHLNAVPVLLFLKNGAVISQIRGALSQDYVDEQIRKYLLN